MSLCICAVSPELSLLIYNPYDVKMTREGSDESVHMCRLIRAFSAHLQSVSTKVQMSLNICAVSPVMPPLLIYKMYEVKVARECSDESVICAVSTETYLVIYKRYEAYVTSERSYVESHQRFLYTSINAMM